MTTPLPVRLLAAALVLLAASGCDSADRTYPEAGTYPEIDTADLLTAAPGLYNTTAYVSNVGECSPAPACDNGGEFIELAQRLSPTLTTTVPLAVEAAEQFEGGARYVFSVEVGAAQARTRQGPEPTGATLQLQGYSEASSR